MSLTPEQKQLFTDLPPVPNPVFVNDRVFFQTEDNQRVILVHGLVFSHYSIEDRCAEAYALVSLFEAGYADQNDLARCFGYSTRTLRRYQERLKSGGLSALARPDGRPSDSSMGLKPIPARERTILRLKAKGMSNRWIGGRLGLSETAVRKSLHRLGWQPDPEPTLLLPLEVDSQAQPLAVSNHSPNQIPPAQSSSPKIEKHAASKAAAKSLDPNPLDRSMDRLLAALGLLDDALPVFAPRHTI